VNLPLTFSFSTVPGGGRGDQHFVVIVLQWNASIHAAMANGREIKHRGS
jgi:hypothetical protein